MRPGAKGLIKVLAGVAVLGLLAVAWIVWTELGTIKADDPISWAMADSSKLGVFLWGLGVSSVFWAPFSVIMLLASHWWWPSRAAYPRVWKAVREFGDPQRLEDRMLPKPMYLAKLESHARHLWKISLLLLLLAAPARAADQPYVELYASSGLLFNETQDGTWVKSEYLGLKGVGRLPLVHDVSLVGRGEIKGVPGAFAYNRPDSFTGLAGDIGAEWVPLKRQGWQAGVLLAYGEVWNLSQSGDERSVDRYSNLGMGLAVRHEATRSWVAAGAIRCRFYGSGMMPRVILHAGLLPATALEADLVWGEFPTVAMSINVGWKK